MGIRRRTASVTLDAYGKAEEDINAKGQVLPLRYAGLFGVKVTHDEPLSGFSVTVHAMDDIDDDDELTYGEQLFYVLNPASGVTYQTRSASTDQVGAAGSGFVLPVIDTSTVRVAVDGGTAAREIEVDVLIETAGDQRF